MYLEFYLLIISLPLPFKMNYQAHVKKKKKTTKNSFVNEPDLLKGFPRNPESPEVTMVGKTGVLRTDFRSIS